MKITILQFGKFKSKPLEEIFLNYIKLISKYADCNFQILNLRGTDDTSITLEKYLDKKTEFKNTNKTVLTVLDEKGIKLSSKEFALKISKIMDSGSPHWIIACGAEHGFSPAIKEKANFILSLSDFIMAHELAMVVLSEQIFRGFTIIKGHPYHNE